MADNIADIRALAARKIQDKNAFLSTGDVDALAAEAAKQYARHRPRVLVEDAAGDGGFDYPLTGGASVLASWEAGFSEVRRVIFPVDDASPAEAALDEDDFTVVTKAATGTQDDHLRFRASAPSPAETFRVFYTARHRLDATASTIPESDDEAVANLTAALCLEAIAARYLSTKDPSLDADVTDHQSRAEEARRLAGAFRRAFLDHLGIAEAGGPAAAGAVVDVDLGYQWGRPFLFHGRRRR